MKKTGILIWILAMFQSSIAQQVPQQNQDFYNYLMKKSKNQKTTANVLLLGGGTLMVTGMLIGLANAAPDGSEEGLAAAGTMAGVGFLSMVASVPFYISSATKRQKARELMVGVGMQKKGNCPPNANQRAWYPAVQLRVRIP